MAGLAARTSALAAGVQVEFTGPAGPRREPLSRCWDAGFERAAPVRGFASYRGQRNWPGSWWFSRTGEHVGYESWVERDTLMALDADPDVNPVARRRWQRPERLPHDLDQQAGRCQ